MDLVQLQDERFNEKDRLMMEHGGSRSSNGHYSKEITDIGSEEEIPLPIPRYEDLIGQTPMVDLSGMLPPDNRQRIRVLAKCEFLNPGFSMKDRIVQNIFDRAEQEGNLRPGSTVVAASSGNTGAAVAMLAAMRGYRAVITTSPKCSKEKMDTIRAYGAKLLVSPPGLAEEDPKSYMNMAKTLAVENEDWFDVNQYDNPGNPEGHYRTMGPEIWAQTKGTITHFVAGGSTGGTISGVGRYLKSMNPSVKVILADPHGSVFHDYIKSGKKRSGKKYLVEGVGKSSSIPGCLDVTVIDDVIQANDKDSFRTCHELARKEGLMVGGSSGLNVSVALKLANQQQEPAVIVTVLCDLGIKYLSKIFNEDWMNDNEMDENNGK